MDHDFITAETYFGANLAVPLTELEHRVSVYAVIVKRNQILMVKTDNNKWYFPGGGLEVGESLEDGVKREVWEELGVEVEVGALLHADDIVYFHDPIASAAQLIRLFYACETQSVEFHSRNAEEQDMFLGIDWVPLNELNPAEFLPSTYKVLQALQERIKE